MKLTQDEALQLVLEAFKVGMLQSGLEARDFALFCAEHDIADVIELGTCAGGLLYLMDRVCKPGLRVSMDMSWNSRDPNCYGLEVRFKAAVPNVVEILGQIHDEAQKNRLAKYLNGRKVDLIFADADHSYEGAKKHFDMYREFIRPGGFFAMHDVANGNLCQEWWDRVLVPDFHDRSWKFVEPANCYGIGVVQL